MTVETRLCVACKACVLACKSENELPDGFYRDWLVEIVRGRFPDLSAENRSERCHHCADPPCVHSCPTGASHVSDGGTVQVTRAKCTGCKACIAACPYDARYVHPDGFVDKCTFCLHRVRAGKDPACVEVCPTVCLGFGDRGDGNSEVARRIGEGRWKILHPEAGCDPQLFFIE